MNNQDSNQSPNREQDANRDPITNEPRSHPIGTGVGAVAGGAAAGAATGTVAGPIGTGIGAAAGAVVGGLAGKAAAEGFNPTKAGELGRFIDYTVIDRNNDRIGTIDAVWEDSTNQPAYLAVRTGWLGLGKAHVVPAESAEVNEDKQRIRLPYDKEQVKSAPSFDSQEDINEDSEFTIASHFGTRTRWREESTPATPPQPTGMTTDQSIPLKEEQVKIGKREVEYGGVRLRKVVRTEVVNKPVELTREEIVVERVPVSGEQASTGMTDTRFENEEIYIPLRREEAVVEKTARTREEVRIGKRRETESQNVQEEVRREDVEVEHDHEDADLHHHEHR